jgi:hypothetical protein
MNRHAVNWSASNPDWQAMLSGTIVPCEDCGSEGRIIVSAPTYYEPLAERDLGPCPTCEGTGGALIETEPLEPEDWFRDLLAEWAAKDADDRQGDFYDGAPDFED